MKNKTTKALLLGVAICLSAITMNAQAFKWAARWNSTGTQKDVGSAVTRDASGNVYVTGGAQYVAGNDRYIETIKYNAFGALQWATPVNVPGSGGGCDFEYGYTISVDASGNVWVAACSYAGLANGFHDDLTLIKYNGSTGAVQTNYPKRYNDVDNCSSGLGGVMPRGISLAVYNSTNVYIGGSTYSVNGASWAYLVLKDNTSGTGWSWTYSYSGSSAGSGKEHLVTDLKADASYVYATGFIQNTSQEKDIWTVKLDASNGSATCGNCWTAQYDNSNDIYNQVANAMAVDASGNVYVAGYKGTASNGNDAVIIKYNSSGAQQWELPYNGNANGSDVWADIALVGTELPFAGFVGGYAKRTSTDFDYSLAAFTSGGVYSTAWATNPLFYDGAGTTEANLTDMGQAVEYSSNTGRVYISGRATENVPANNNVNITTRGYNTSNGSNVWSASYDYGSDAVVGTDEMAWKYGLLVKYNTTNCVDDIYIEGDSYSSSAGYDFLTLKYGGSGGCPQGPEVVRLINANMEEKTGIYPNPFSDNSVLRLSHETEIKNGVLALYDIMGNIVSVSERIQSNTILIEKGNMPNGLYFYNLTDNGNILSKGKFVITD